MHYFHSIPELMFFSQRQALKKKIWLNDMLHDIVENSSVSPTNKFLYGAFFSGVNEPLEFLYEQLSLGYLYFVIILLFTYSRERGVVSVPSTDKNNEFLLAFSFSSLDVFQG
ncbi:hypothetical protein CEXT_71771 [Caerostris extrusa]|uniref:Maturase K n=1 Tax=Caerostris extrusa TaxID=172846 RepID=A0AAV4T802_CAEEX|nr:hypothetical protein CEXT_71771 [Caerostris extrusa]